MHFIPSISAFDRISADLRLILRGLSAILGYWRLETPAMLLASRRISRSLCGIEALLGRFLAGRLRRVADRRRQALHARASRKRDPEAATPGLPRKFGWMVQAGGYRAVGYGLQLQAVLAMPEMAALLAASPQAVRILRPLCRGLAIELPWVRGETPKPRARKPRTPRPKPEPFRIPLPRGVISWSRRERALEKAKNALR